MKYGVIDLETNILNNSYGPNKAAWFHPKNGIVVGQINTKSTTDLGAGVWKFSSQAPTSLSVLGRIFPQIDFLVGHNIKFDLLYIRKFYNELYCEFIKRGGYVWDTQVVEYILSGQEKKYPSLDYCSEKYGGTLKPDTIKEYWQNGIDTADIPRGELEAYLNGDVENTETVFLAQMERVEAMGLMPLVSSQMEALLALVEIEYNGMYYAKEQAYSAEIILASNTDLKEKWLIAAMKGILPHNMYGMAEITPNSPKQLSLFLFGGEVEVKGYETMTDPTTGEPVLYKSGPNKGLCRLRVKRQKFNISQAWSAEIKSYARPMKRGLFSTDDETLNAIVNNSSSHIIVEFCQKLLQYREMNKDLTTYYRALRGLCVDNLIHPNYNQCSTATGRLSSSTPNAQNLTKKDDS